VLDPFTGAGSQLDPLSGCQDPSTAAARAADLLAGLSAPGQRSDRDFWASQARRVLAALLQAAALGEGSMRDVLAWVADPAKAPTPPTRCMHVLLQRPAVCRPGPLLGRGRVVEQVISSVGGR
jgi:hypothetical protein